MLKKMGEEAVEVIIAAKGETDERVLYELADFIYHTLVFLASRGLSWEDVEGDWRGVLSSCPASSRSFDMRIDPKS